MNRPARILAVLTALGLAGPAAAFSPEPAAEAMAPLAAISATGILLDRAIPLSSIDRFDGSVAAPAANAALWRQMYDEIRRAARRPVGPPVEALREETRRAVAAGEIPVAFVDFQVERVRPRAVEEGAIEIRDGRLVPVGPGALTTGRVFAAAALHDRTFRGSRVTFSLERSAYFSDEPPVELEIDFADGRGPRTFRLGDRPAVRYASEGLHTVRVRARFADGSIRQAAFRFDVRRLSTPIPNDTLAVTATVPYQGQFGTGEAYLYLAPAHAVLTNPVIVIEGFDLDDTMNWEELYEILAQENLVERLRDEGFDAVVLNFTEATEPLQRNAFVVAELIQQVNAIVPPPTTSTVIGASMGALCARYALAWLESQAVDHRTRTFVSFDGPHAGANIPLGIQYWLDFFQEQSADAAFLLSRLDTPAARQMLLYHHTSPPGTTGEPDPLRTDFLADLAAVGDWPAAPRKVAVANGSGHALGQGFAPGEQIIEYTYRSFLVDIDGNVWAVPDGSPATIFDGLFDLLLFPPVTMTVTVAGTLPWDNAPGGARASMAEMDSTEAPYGDIVALWDRHCFVPTISALALCTVDPFFDVSAEPDPLSLTPFDAIYYPAVNEDHIQITPESAGWFLGEIRSGALSVLPGATPAGAGLVLAPSAPNPFRSTTWIRFRLGDATPVTVDVHDVQGRLVRRIADEAVFPAGEHALRWERGSLSAGVYLYRVRAGGSSAEGKAVLLR